MEEEKKSKVSWNLGEAIIIELSTLLKICSRHFLKGNMRDWFTSLRAVKMRILPKLGPEERTHLKKIELKIWNLKRANKPYAYLVEDYNEIILDHLEDYGFYPKNLEDSTKIN